MKITTILAALIITSAFFGLENLSGQFAGNFRDEVELKLIKHQYSQAEKHYKKEEYTEAIYYYQKLRDKSISPDSLRRNLAYSYYHVNNMNSAEATFRSLVKNDEATGTDIYYYAQTLRANKKYKEADKWMKKYRSIKGDDRRADLQAGKLDDIKELYKTKKYSVSPVYFNSPYSDFGAFVHEGEILFTSGRDEGDIIKYQEVRKGDPYLDVYSTSVERPVDYKSPKVLSKGLNSRFHDGPMCYSSNGQEVYLTRNGFNRGMPAYSENKQNNFMIYFARITTKGWDKLELLPFNNADYSCGHPSISADGKKLYFASNMSGGQGGSDIYYVERTAESWGEPVNLGPDVNTPGDEMFPFINHDGVLYFASDGHLGLGGLDIFKAQPGGKDMYTVSNMGYPLNSSADDFSIFIDKDSDVGYFASNRKGGRGDDDIYKFVELNEEGADLKLTVVVKDKETGITLPNVELVITNLESNETIKEASNNKGLVSTYVSHDFKYKLSATKAYYKLSEMEWKANKARARDNNLQLEIMLIEENEEL
ncbi:MAG: hypothetical protein MI922_05490 [Bacteroidales bacterium]|nr:hypothetical protein [Bacteroidales bacterium]